MSDCSYANLLEVSKELDGLVIMAADVNVVKDIHTNYGVSSAPSLLVFSDGKFEKSVKGCNDNNYYK